MSTIFFCSFDKIPFYPFGIQECSFEIGSSNVVDKKLGLIKPNTSNALVKESEYVIGQYVIKDWEVSDTTDFNTVRFTMKMKRNSLKILIVTYLPTTLMNLLNQAVVYIKSDSKYDLIITVNITCMMVLASVYLSGNSSKHLVTKSYEVDTYDIIHFSLCLLTKYSRNQAH